MKTFIFKTLGLGSIIVLLFFGVLSLADKYTDSSYIRFTTPIQENLILGTSEAAMGLQPSIINEILGLEIYNYAFTMAQSPYGPSYLRSIKRKLNPNTTDGIFIVGVGEGNISTKKGNTPNDTLTFRELQYSVAKTSSVDKNPNFHYIIKNNKGKFYQILINKITRPTHLYDDGWMEVNSNYSPSAIETKTKKKIISYQKSASERSFSDTRCDYLLETVLFLKEHGKVYLVKFPKDPRIVEIEREYMPDFDEKIKDVIKESDAYLDLSPQSSSFKYQDGTHLTVESSIEVSRIVANWIRGQKK